MRQVGFRIVHTIERPPEGLIERLARFRSADLSDGMRKAGTMVGIGPVYTPLPQAIGPAVTVSVPAGGINIVKVGLELTRPGDILVVNAHGATTSALWGGNLSQGAQARGLRGLVVDGAVRDPSEIRSLDFPIWSRGVATGSNGVDSPAGEVNVPIACGGVVVTPGDIVVADEDGVVVVPPAFAEEVMASTEELLARFDALRPTLRSGGVTNIEGILADLRAKGIAEIL